MELVDPGSGASACAGPEAGEFEFVVSVSGALFRSGGPEAGVRAPVDPVAAAFAPPFGPEAGVFGPVDPGRAAFAALGVGEFLLSEDPGARGIVLSAGTDEGVFAGPGAGVSEAVPEAGVFGVDGGSEAGGVVELAALVALFAATDLEVVEFGPFRRPADHVPSAPFGSGVLT
ncbi:hypothetical protein AB4305_05770 [Nocardia sp. 2YAB30]|uniref:hypothetical protein n=1 Tax=unclassified Nocardia TaxID=2637762 RepID=UPI003F9A401C